MRPDWMPADPTELRIKAAMAGWERMREEGPLAAEREAVRLQELWAGINPGDVVELSVDATVRRGGLRIYGADGEIRREQVRVMEIEGEVARCRGLMGWRRGHVEVMEWIARAEIERVGKEGLAVINENSALRYWN